MSAREEKMAVTLVQTGECYRCSAQESLLAGMAHLGRRGIPAGCRSGGCGVCKVRVARGAIRQIGPVSRAHVSAEEEAQGYTLACRAAPVSDVHLEAAACLDKVWRNCVPRADASGGAALRSTLPSTPII